MQDKRLTRYFSLALRKTTACAAVACMLLGSSPIVSAQTSSGLYKWVDEDGNIRYSDRVPASQAKQGHQQLNRQGIVIETQERALTEEEKEAARLAAIEEEKRQIAEQERLAEEARQAAIQAEKDRVLLLTFSSEEELTDVFNNRTAVIDSVIGLIEKSIETTEKQLERLQTNAENTYTSKGQEIPGGLAQQIEFAERKIENRTNQLLLKQDEKGRLLETYQIDLSRFRVLHAND